MDDPQLLSEKTSRGIGLGSTGGVKEGGGGGVGSTSRRSSSVPKASPLPSSSSSSYNNNNNNNYPDANAFTTGFATTTAGAMTTTAGGVSQPALRGTMERPKSGNTAMSGNDPHRTPTELYLNK